MNLGLSPDPEQRFVPTPRTDLQVGAGDGLAGPVYDPDAECARLSKSDDRRSTAPPFGTFTSRNSGPKPSACAVTIAGPRLTTSEGVLPRVRRSRRASSRPDIPCLRCRL